MRMSAITRPKNYNKELPEELRDLIPHDVNAYVRADPDDTGLYFERRARSNNERETTGTNNRVGLRSR